MPSVHRTMPGRHIQLGAGDGLEGMTDVAVPVVDTLEVPGDAPGGESKEATVSRAAGGTDVGTTPALQRVVKADDDGVS